MAEPLQRLLGLWPRQIGNQCLLMLTAGTVLGLVAPELTGWLTPLATLFLQASQIVVMPYLICELIVGFGQLRPGSLGQLARRGGAVLLGLWAVAAVLVVAAPLCLPPLVTSEFFHAGLFERNEPVDLLTTYLPDNIFGALAADNFPAVVLFSCVLGVLLQSIDGKQALLEPLQVIRTLVGRLNKLVVRLIPYGIFALMAINVARFDGDQLIRMQGFLALCLLSFVLLSLACALSVISLTPLGLGALWRIVKGPLALTASSTNLLIALPMLVSNLQEMLPPALEQASGRAPDPEHSAQSGDELAPLVSLGYALPTLGQVATLVFIPFAAWYVDQALEPQETATMLLSAIPASVSGVKAVVRQELLQLGLPIDLLQLVYINGEWLYRFEKVLSLEGLVVLAVLVYAHGVGLWRPRPAVALAGTALVLALGSVMGLGSRTGLAAALKDTYRNDDRLLRLGSLFKGNRATEVSGVQPIEPVSLAAIQRRRVLRVGLRNDGLPWAYRNSSGALVGFDVDLLQALAANLAVRLELQQAPLENLERWLNEGRLDLLAGGIQTSPGRATRFELSRSYLTVHLALVVPDARVRLLQGGRARSLGRPVVLAVPDRDLLSPGLEEQLGRYLADGQGRVQVVLQPIESKRAFFSAHGQRTLDGLLTTAESGAAWAVLHPRTSLITPFRDKVSSELVWLIGGKDASLRRYINGWLSRELAQGGIDQLFQHWILLKDS